MTYLEVGSPPFQMTPLIGPQQLAREIQIQGCLAEIIVAHALRQGHLHARYGRAFAIITIPTEMSAVVPTSADMLETGHFLLDLQGASLRQALKAILPKNLGLHQAVAEEERATQRPYQLRKAW
jgi:hypothetical protein